MNNFMIHTPVGVKDLYGDDLKRKHLIKNKLHSLIAKYGYKDIETPTFEFYDLYSSKIGSTPDRDLYKFFDKDGSIIALRPDFTPSMARCSAKYFLEDSMPIRLSYEGHAFCNVTELQGKLKETDQMGVELYDTNYSVDADAEMVCLMIESLTEIGFKDFQIVIGEVDYLNGIIAETKLNSEATNLLKDYLASKNYFGAEELLKKENISKELIEDLLEVSDINSIDDLRAIKDRISNEKSISAIERLEKIYDILEKLSFEKYISFDLSMVSKFHYYTGVIFRAYTYGVGDSIIKGGRYDKLLSQFGKESKAVGFVFMIDEIMTALSRQKLNPELEVNYICVVYNEKNRFEALKAITALRKEGKNVAALPYDPSKCRDEYIEYANKNKASKIEFFLD